MRTSVAEQIRFERTPLGQTSLEDSMDRLRQTSVVVDQSGKFSLKNWELLGRARLLGLTVPKEFGGLGAEVSYWLEVVRQIGMACPSTALCFLMHLCATSVIVAVASPAIKRRYLPKVATGQLTVAYAGTEHATGTNFWALESSAVKVNEGWRLRLRKDWATLADVADLFIVPTRAHPAAAADEISLFLVERSAGVKSCDAWRGTGMRGSSSGPVEVDAVVPNDHLMGTPGKANDYVATDMFNLLLLSHAALYSGIADEAFSLAVERAIGRSFVHRTGSLAATSLWQSRLGELSAELAACRALIESAGRTIETGNQKGRLLKEALAAKLAACTAARRSTDLALQIHGGSGYNIGERVEMLWRDARAGSLMRPSDEVTSMILGRLETDQPPFEL